MGILFAICLLLQVPVNDPAFLDVDFSSEITIMPDCRMRHVMALDIRKDALPPKMKSDVVNTFAEDLKKMSASHRARVSSAVSSNVTYEKGEKYQWILFCDDVNGYQWTIPERGEYIFERKEGTFRLTMKQTALDSLLLPPPTIHSAREVIVMPGKVTLANGVHVKSERMAITELTIRDLGKESDGEKVRLSKVAPRVIECGPATIPQSEIDAFNKEYEAAINRK